MAASNSPCEPELPGLPPPPEVSRDRAACRLPSSPPPWRVFLSHTSEFRRFPSTGGSYIDKAEKAVSAPGHVIGNMEGYRASDGDIGAFDEWQVQNSQVYLGIFGMRWGTPLPDQPELSYTVQEFEAASAAGIPRLIFVVDEDDDSGDVRIPSRYLRDDDHGHRQQAFLQRIHSSGELIIKRFRGPDHLAGLVETSLRELERQLGLAAVGADPSPARPTYTSAHLQRWVERHQHRLAAAFEALQTVRDRRVHVPLEVRLALAMGPEEATRLLEPADLAPLLESGGNHLLLLSGDGGAGKTSLAFAIVRWLIGGQPDGVVRLPVLIETALAPGETVADRVRAWLGSQLAGVPAADLEPELIEALLAAKRLIPIVDHLSELTPAARDQLLAALPPGLVVVTSRSDDDGFRERPLSRIVPQGIGLNRVPDFFLDYLRSKNLGDQFTSYDLVPAQAQLLRIVGDKPITVLLAQMFIDDVIDNREEGLLAGSVPELMLRYVKRLDTPADRALRRRAGLLINEALVQRALRVVALASHRQPPNGEPLYQPLEFSEALARASLMAAEPAGLALTREQAQALLAYLIELRLLLQAGARAGQLRFPLDPLADHLAAAEQLEQLEEQALLQGPGVWEAFLATLEPRPEVERDRMRGFLLALRDGAMEAQRGRALLMPATVPDRLAQLGFLDPEGERYRLALQRARKWMWELGVPEPAERRDGIAKLAAMAAAVEDSERRAARDVACRRLARLLAEELSEQQVERQQEQQEAALVLGLMGSPQALAALQSLAANPDQPQQLRRKALESLGLAARRLPGVQGARQRAQIETFLQQWLHSDSLDLLVDDEGGWAEHDRRLPLLQGASRGLQLAASADLPLLGSGPGLVVPMLTLTAVEEGSGLRIRTEVVEVPVWRLPLPGGEQLELVMVPAGPAQLGSPSSEHDRQAVLDWFAANRDGCRTADGRSLDLEALRSVQLEAFAMVRQPISQGQWRAVVEAVDAIERELDAAPGKANPQGLWEHHGQPGELAVDSVSWHDCQEWLRRLNRWLEEQGGPQLALPSENQWEGACRAGAATPFHFGDALDGSWACYDATYTFGRSRKGVSKPKQPWVNGSSGLVNRWGLAELHGQLLEWCEDTWHPNPVGQGHPQDGAPWREEDAELVRLGSGQRRWKLLRGGSWFGYPRYCRSACRSHLVPGHADYYIGFRVVCLPQGPSLNP